MLVDGGSRCQRERDRGASADKRGRWADPLSLLGYEYRMMECLHSVTRKLVAGENLSTVTRLGWRERYCADIRTRDLLRLLSVAR